MGRHVVFRAKTPRQLLDRCASPPEALRSIDREGVSTARSIGEGVDGGVEGAASTDGTGQVA